METSIDLLRDFAVVLMAAAVTTVVCARLKQPLVLGYLVAGLLVGPNVFPAISVDLEHVHMLAELGVALLMFSVGLEFSIQKLVSLGRSSALIAAIETGLVGWSAFVAARAVGLETEPAVFAGVAVAISSTVVVAKVFDSQGVSGAQRQLVFGVLVVEDLIAVLALAVMAGMGARAQADAGTLGRTLTSLAGYLALFLVGGLAIVPRLLRWVVATRQRETMRVASIGLCLGFALLARSVGFSPALGAFLAGTLAAESGHAARLEPLIMPVRDVFAALFFVSIGMLIEPLEIVRNYQLVLLLGTVVVAGKLLGVTLGAVLAGHEIPAAIHAGMSLAQIGEFSFLIAAAAAPYGESTRFLLPVAATICVITSFSTPFMVRGAEPLARWVDRRLPRRLQTFQTLYASWLERLSERLTASKAWRSFVRPLAWIAVDAVAIGAIVISAASTLPLAVDVLHERFGIPDQILRLGVIATAVVACTPFLTGIFLLARRIAATLARDVLPQPAERALDLAAAPRRAMELGLRIAILAAVGMPLVAVTQPFLPSAWGPLVLLAALAAPALVWWRSVANLEGHVRAGSQLVAEALTRAARRTATDSLGAVSEMLPGMGSLTVVALEERAWAIGRSLDDVDVHGRTGAKVMCLSREGVSSTNPVRDEELRLGDIVVLTGADDAVAEARRLLVSGE